MQKKKKKCYILLPKSEFEKSINSKVRVDLGRISTQTLLGMSIDVHFLKGDVFIRSLEVRIFPSSISTSGKLT